MLPIVIPSEESQKESKEPNFISRLFGFNKNSSYPTSSDSPEILTQPSQKNQSMQPMQPNIPVLPVPESFQESKQTTSNISPKIVSRTQEISQQPLLTKSSKLSKSQVSQRSKNMSKIPSKNITELSPEIPTIVSRRSRSVSRKLPSDMSAIKQEAKTPSTQLQDMISPELQSLTSTKEQNNTGFLSNLFGTNKPESTPIISEQLSNKLPNVEKEESQDAYKSFFK
jgi:hypothetical protein